MKLFSTRRVSLLGLSLAVTACGSDTENLAPVFNNIDAVITVSEDSVYDGLVSVTDESTVTFTVASAANNGVFTLNSDGSYRYTPNTDFTGTDTVSVTASDSELTSSTSISFDVSNVNDLPMLNSTSVTVSATGETQGQLSFSDVDGDTVTVTLLSTDLAGELTLDSATGEFTYTSPELTPVDTSFSISYTDGVIADAIEAEISLTPSYVSNSDKHAYYYASAHSHLKQAETINTTLLTDDVLQDQSNGIIATGYAQSGFTDKSVELLDGINTLDAKALGYRTVAKVLHGAGHTETSADMRGQAQLYYNLFLAQKGLENINSDDAGFMMTLLNNIIDSGDSLAQQDLAFTLETYATAVGGEMYNTPYGKFLTSFRNNAKEFMDIYSADPTAETQADAESAIDRFAVYVNNMAKQQINSNRNGNKGLFYDRLKTYYLYTAAEYYYRIGAMDKAKQYLATGLSMYTDVSYDTDYTIAATEFAELNSVENTFYLADYAGLFEILYPNAETNFALSLIDPTSRDYDSAIESIVAYTALNNLLDGVDLDTALAPVISYYENDKPRYVFDALIEQSAMAPRIAVLLVEQNEDELALQVINKMSDILTSEEYITAQTISKYVLGYEGCARLVNLINITGESPVSLASACATAANDYFGADKTFFSLERSIVAFIELMNVQYRAADTAGVTLAATTAFDMIKQLDDSLDQIDYGLELATTLVTYQQFDQANTVFSHTMTIANTLLADETLSFSDMKKAIGYIQANVARYSDAGTGFFQRFAYIKGMRRGAATQANYADLMTSTLSQLQTVATTMNTAVATLTVDDQLAIAKEALLINLHAQLLEQANLLVNSTEFSDSDRLSLNVIVLEYHALRDDFPATPVATIDTDNDGKPDFFALDASEEAIAESGLVADEDNDNDGTANDSDITPIG